MVKILEENKPIICDCCKAKISFDAEDIKTKLIIRGPCDYGGDGAGTEEHWKRYVTCPKCNNEITINYFTNYL